MIEEAFEGLKQIIEYRSVFRELEFWLYNFIHEHDKGEMTIQELHDKVREMVEAEE